MQNRRTNIQIIAEILRLGKADVGKTNIMYNVNMSYSQLEKYISFLTGKEFLQTTNGSNSVKYHTTPKGNDLLHDIDKMAVVLGFEPDASSEAATDKREGEKRKSYARGKGS